jgi:hypothetical protein
MKQYKIASLGKDNKVGYSASGHKIFIPERFRDNVKVGDYALTVDQTFDQRTDPSTGQLVKVEPWTRETTTFIGSFKEAVLAMNEEKILAGVGEAIVKQEIVNQRKELKLEDVAAAIGA